MQTLILVQFVMLIAVLMNATERDFGNEIAVIDGVIMKTTTICRHNVGVNVNL